ncbi:sulfatase [Bacteroidota bacterium]
MKFRSNIYLLIMLVASSCNPAGKDAPPPNILLINIDDLGWVDVGFMGAEFYETPNMDVLAEAGLVFTQAYAGAANCAPSRACMMTGLNTPRHGIYTVASSERGASKDRKLIPTPNNVTLHDSLTTIAEVLQLAGYRTCQAGKWHLSNDSRDHGFDVNIGGNHAGHPNSYYPPYKNIDLEAPNGEYLTDNIMNRVLDYLEQPSDKPFFLYYSPYAVHTPIQKVDSLMYRFTEKKGPEGMNHMEYASMILNLDRNIGRLIDKLRELGAFENTFFIFTSDNGGLYRISRQTPLRAGKGSYYEGGIRVPMFFHWKDRIKPGINTTTPVSNLDFFPTINELAGVNLPGKTFDGISLLPLLMENKIPDLRPFFWHFPVYLESGNQETRDPMFRTRPGSVIRYGKWKLQHYLEDDAIELFNLEEDPGELLNLAEKNPGKANELLKLLDEWRIRSGAPLPTELNPDYVGGK